MPGNELGDRFLNFCPRNNLSQEQHHSQVVGGDCPAVNSNFLEGNRRLIDLADFNTKSYNLHNSERDRGSSSYSGHTSSLKLGQSTLRTDLIKSQSQSKQSELNGSMHNSQFQHMRKNEANFLAMDTHFNQRHLLNSSGLSVQEIEQRSVLDHQAKNLARSGTSVSPISFDLFGGQPQMSHHHPRMLQPLQHQQPAFNDMQQPQQEVMLRKVQELQMQQQLRQVDSRQQNFPFTKQASGNQSSPQINGTPSSDAFHYPWVADQGNTNWLHHGSPTIQESLNVSPLNLGQAQHSVDLVQQLANQSIYGIPISGSRGLTGNPYSQMAMDRPQMLQMSTLNSSLAGNQLSDHVSMQDGTSVSRHGFQNEDMLGRVSSQAFSTGTDIGSVQQVNLRQRNAPELNIRGRQNEAISQEGSHEKPTKQYSSNQSEAALDPTEERILFGSDDNIWAAFGKSPDISGDAGNFFDNGALPNGLPSIQSGRWSALMQSALAETSNSDMGPQDEWTGLVSTEVHSANQLLSPYNDSGKQDESLNNNNRMHSALLSGLVPPSDDNRMNNNHQNAIGFDKFGQKFQGKASQISQSEMSQSLVQSMEEANRWSNCSPLRRSVAEGNQSYNNVSKHSLDGEKNAKSGSTVWISEHSGRKQEPTSWKSLGSVKHAMGHDGGLSMNNAASLTNSSARGIDLGNSQFVQNSYLLNQWKNDNPMDKSRIGEGLGEMLHRANEKNQVSDSRVCDREEVTAHEMDNSDLKGNSNEIRSNLLPQVPMGLRENRLSDASESRNLPTGKEQSVHQLGRKASGPRKFQYHPMGNLDEDLEYANGIKQPTSVLSMSQQNVHLGVSKFFDQGQVSDHQRDNKGLDEGSARGSVPGYTPNTPVPSNSQNMLELLHKVDQSTDHGSRTHLNPSEQNASSQLVETENYDVPVDGHQHNQSSASQGFRLQLGPPLQRMQISEHSQSSKSVQHANSSYASHATAEIGEKSTHLPSTSSIQSLPFSIEQSQTRLKHERSGLPGQAGNGTSLYEIPGNFSSALSSGIAYPVSHLHHQQITSAVGQSNQISSWGTSRQTSTQHVRGSTDMSARDPVPASQSLAPPGISRHGSAQKFRWITVPAHQQNMGVQIQKVSVHFPESPYPNIVESSSSVPQTIGDLYLRKGENLSSQFSGMPMNSAVVSGEGQRLEESSDGRVKAANPDVVQKMNESHGKASSVKHTLVDSPANSFSTQRDIEAFGRSLQPDTFSRDNYSLLNQVQAMYEPDPNNRASKRMRGPGTLEAAQANEHSAVDGDSLGSSAAVPSGDSRIQRSTMSADILEKNITSEHGNIVSQDVLAFGQDFSMSSSCGPQIAPSWFDQYGTLKNGQILPTYDGKMVTALRAAEPPFTVGKYSSSLYTSNSVDDESLVGGNLQSSIPSAAATEHFSSPDSLHRVILEPKKRKDASTELHPWHKEVSEGLQSLQTLRMAEVNWRKVANRRTEKVEDIDLIEDGLQVLRSKRRLILTTQLMQQLFCPPPAAILSADTNSGHESAVYAVSRMALGEACSAVSHSGYSDMPCDGENLSAKYKQSQGTAGRPFGKAIKEFMGRAMKLENEFLRLDKSASILDLRVESQDVEKFSVINRFARFHGRGQSESTEAASTSDVMSNIQKPCPQRYVSALPMPRSIPDRVQCLSL